MAKGKSNPKTVERVKGMTKAMRNEMERAEAEAAATEAAARSAKEKKKGRRRGDPSSDEDEDEGAENAALTQNNKQSKGNKVQIGGFGIGCRGTGNEKARRLKEEHDEKTRKKKATKARLAAERSAAAAREGSARDGSGVDDDDADESWRVRNPTVNKKANRGKQKRGKKERDDDDDDDEDEDENVARLKGALEGRSNEEGASDADDDPDDPDESPFLRGSSGASFPAARAAAASAFSLLRGDDEEEEDEEDEEENNTDGEKTKRDVDDDDDDDDDDSERHDSEAGRSTTDRLTNLVLDDDATADPPAERDGAVEDVVVANADADTDAASASESESSSSDWETDEEKDADASPNPFASLFDAHESETVAENLEYMRVKHGFVVPYRDSLADPEGFVRYLRRKIVRRKQCLFCQKRFLTLEGVRGHMRDAGHVRVRFEPPAVFRGNPLFDEAIARANADGYEPEYGEFYDFGDGPGRASIQSENGDVSGTSALFDSNRVGGGLELVLRDKHGRTKQLGHRSFRRYYKQKFRNDYVARGSKADEKRVAAAAPAARLAERERNKQTNAIATRSMRVALRGASKALAAQFTTKAGFADNAARRAIVHHWGAGGGGSHYHTAGSKQFLKGVRIKGVVSRHSKQGAKMQAARVQAARNKQNRGNASVAVLRSGTRKG